MRCLSSPLPLKIQANNEQVSPHQCAFENSAHLRGRVSSQIVVDWQLCHPAKDGLMTARPGLGEICSPGDFPDDSSIWQKGIPTARRKY